MDTMDDKSVHQFMATFITKDSRFAIPSTPYAINGSTDGLALNSLIKTLIAETFDDQQSDLNLEDTEFDFIINNKLLRVSVQEFVENEETLSVENELQIEFFAKWCPPKPHNSLLHDDWVSCVDCHHNWIISGCYDNSVHIWDLNSDGSHKIAIPAHLAPIKAVKWIVNESNDSSNDHMFVTTSHDELAIVWKWNSQSNQVEYLFSCRGHSRSVDCVDVNNDLIATGSYDQMLKIWSLADPKHELKDSEPSTSAQKKSKKNDGSERGDKNRIPVITLSGHKEAITGCVWMNKLSETSIANISTCSMDNTIRIWDIEVAENKQTLTSNKAFLAISYSSFNTCLITGSCDRHIRLWDPRTSSGSLVSRVYTSHQAWVSAIDWSKTNEYHFISGSYDNIVKQWDIRSANAPLFDLIGHEDKVLCVNWSSDKYMISGSADNHLKIFSNLDNKIIKS
ncbi:ribosome biogenesis protein WDR12 homolog [Oppia nitens]|uniref:ribosome biogenesis protein WDR12 homolog n=1 Tax=Oppia nitens TaxID=1686743 RepID=UPI0023DC4BAA|nr:ribosome biogenesis protein WDR12 homolog [Oppia nitens]